MPCRLVSRLLISTVVGIEAHRSNRRNAGLLGLEVEGPKECTELQNFTTSSCLISVSPGACYVTTGKEWSCWSTGDPVQSDQFCKQHHFAGACIFKDHGKVRTDEEIDDCTKLPFFKAQCNPTTDKWGACYLEGSTTNDGWLCVPDDSLEDIERYRRGDCQSQLVPPGKNQIYTDVCRFPKKQQSVFKCETVPSYGPGDSKTNCGAENRAACFSLDKEATWSCQEQKSMNPSCATTPVSTMPQSATYEGACLFKGAPGHKDALVYGATPPTTAGAPTTVGAISYGAPTTIGAASVVPVETTSIAPPRAISTSTHSGTAAHAPIEVALLAMLVSLAVSRLQ